ncbi:Scaffold attachment factor B2 [Armadillidium vulgare]|nr:Scaffold attachment factor B2 [Armadillidium vulgare]
MTKHSATEPASPKETTLCYQLWCMATTRDRSTHHLIDDELRFSEEDLLFVPSTVEDDQDSNEHISSNNTSQVDEKGYQTLKLLTLANGYNRFQLDYCMKIMDIFKIPYLSIIMACVFTKNQGSFLDRRHSCTCRALIITCNMRTFMKRMNALIITHSEPVQEGISENTDNKKSRTTTTTGQETSASPQKINSQSDVKEEEKKNSLEESVSNEKNSVDEEPNIETTAHEEDVEEEEREELRDLEEELMMEGEEVEENAQQNGNEMDVMLSKEEEEYARHMEDDSINLMLEDDDKMLDYEENDRTDMFLSVMLFLQLFDPFQEETSNADGKDKDGTGNSSESHSKSDSRGKNADGSEKDHSKSSRNREGKESDEKEGSSAEASSSRNLWVSGLASNTRAQDLKSLFSKHGKVLSAKIVTNAKTPGAKCYGFVTMATIEDANKCIKNLNKTELHGRMIQVEKVRVKWDSKSKSGTSSSLDKDKRKSSPRERGGRSSTRERGRSSRGKSLSQSRSERKSNDRDRNRHSKESDLRNRLSAKERVEDRRHEAKRSGFSSSQNKRSSSRRDVLSLHRNVLVTGNSIAGVIGDKLEIASSHGVEVEVQSWPDENLTTIINNAKSIVKPHHEVVILFGLTFEAWNYVSFLENQYEPRIVVLNPTFSLDSVAEQLNSFVFFCKSVNPQMKVYVVMPPIQDMFLYNVSRVKKYAPDQVSFLEKNPTFNRKTMAENSRIVFSKMRELFNRSGDSFTENFISCYNILKPLCTGPTKRYFKVCTRKFLLGKSDNLDMSKALFDGLHPTDLFIDKFWGNYVRLCRILSKFAHASEPREIKMSGFKVINYGQNIEPILIDSGHNIEPINCFLHTEPAQLLLQNSIIPPAIYQDLRSTRIDNNHIMEERERQRLRTRERLMREEERMRRDEEIHLRTLERRQKEEAERLHREREKLRIEREKVERQKQELLRLEREQQRLEREKLERERDELRKQQMKYEEVRRGVKRPAPSSERDRRDYFDDRKRGPDRVPPSRVPDRIAERGAPDRVHDRGMHRGADIRGGSDRGASMRGNDRVPERGGGGGGRYNDERDSRYERHNERPQYDERREREERRPIDRPAIRGEGRDHRGPPPASMRDRSSRDGHYNGSSMNNGPMDTWRTGSVSHSSKNGPSYGSSNGGMMSGGGSVSGSLGGRGVDSQGGWRPSSSMSTNERWGGNSGGMGGRNSSSVMDILRGADSYHMGGGQVPMNPVPLMSGMSQCDRYGNMGFRK